MLDPAAPGAEIIDRLWWIMLVGSTLILGGVMALFLYAFLDRRRGRDMNGNWLVAAGGIGLPALALPVLLGFALRDGEALLAHPKPDAFRIEVRAHQWWWEFIYPDVAGAPVYTANELHIPAARPVQFTILGGDVIHSFWVPRLGHKVDAIPGHIHLLELQARAPGIYTGVCSEFCGLQHANMHFLVEAHGESELQERLARLASAGPTGVEGAEDFTRHCARCHSVDPRRRVLGGPNLAGIGSRRWIGGGVLSNEGRASILEWLTRHHTLKPGSREPYHLASVGREDLERIATYLERLK